MAFSTGLWTTLIKIDKICTNENGISKINYNMPPSPGFNCTLPIDLLRLQGLRLSTPSTMELCISTFFLRASVPSAYFFIISSSIASSGLQGIECCWHMFASATEASKRDVSWKIEQNGMRMLEANSRVTSFRNVAMSSWDQRTAHPEVSPSGMTSLSPISPAYSA